MADPHTKRCPASSTSQLLDLISSWREEAVQSQLHSNQGYFDMYSQISHFMVEKGYEWDTLPCCAKIKELRQGYQKNRESNRDFGAEPKTCHFYKELEAIIGNPTYTIKRLMDTSAGPAAADTRLNPNEEVVDKEVELEDSAEQRTRLFADMGNQDLFLTPDGLSQSSGSGMQDAGESNSGNFPAPIGNHLCMDQRGTQARSVGIQFEAARMEKMNPSILAYSPECEISFYSPHLWRAVQVKEFQCFLLENHDAPS